MATPSMHSNGQHRSGYHCNRCLGAYQQEEKGKSVEEVQSREISGGTLVENCFTTENSASDQWVIVNLEKELHVSLRFVDGEGEPTNSIWIVGILLGRLIWEWTAIGQAIKLFAKFQHHEIMREMVKLNDLADMAEPPLHGSMEGLLENQRL